MRDLLAQALRQKLVDKMQEMGVLRSSMKAMINDSINKSDKSNTQILDELVATVAAKKRKEEREK